MNRIFMITACKSNSHAGVTFYRLRPPDDITLRDVSLHAYKPTKWSYVRLNRLARTYKTNVVISRHFFIIDILNVKRSN